MDSTKNNLIGSGFIMLAALLWGSGMAVRKLGIRSMEPLTQNAFRFLAALIFILIVLYFRHTTGKTEIHKLFLKEQIIAGIPIGLVYALGAMFQQMGLVTMTAGETGFLTSLYTILVPLMMRILFHEKVKMQIWVAACFSLMGLYLISDGFNLIAEPGILFILAGTAMYGIQIILIDRKVKDNDPFILVTVELAMGLAVNIIMAMLMGESTTVDIIIVSLPTILYTGVISLGVANLSQFVGQQRANPSIVAILCSFESLFAMLFGIVLLRETFTVRKIAGCSMFFVAVIISQVM